jgi:hypothetical protein
LSMRPDIGFFLLARCRRVLLRRDTTRFHGLAPAAIDGIRGIMRVSVAKP